ncbi:MAG: DUF2285 domain-containing protein [Alphaproteobacteria bacterium]|nr:DUF2285 domain-containing protein [Alphaproteobacteria bacterium]MDE2493104.1 DUF2285 domain-containing protein [Alphaproteobacteria bacterium]
MPTRTPVTDIAEDVPWSDALTPYDEANLVLYVRLLDACAAGASDDEMVRVLFGIDPRREPDRARRTLASHLRRARWMTEHGYKHFLE